MNNKILYGIIGILAIVLLFSQCNSCKNKKKLLDSINDVQIFKGQLSDKDYQLKTWKAKDSTNVAEIRTLKVDKSVLIEMNDDLYTQLKAKGIKKPEKNVTGITVVKTETRDKIITRVDTLYQNTATGKTEYQNTDTLAFSYVSKYLKLNGKLYNHIAEIDYTKSDSLYLVRQNRKRWFLGSNKTFLTVFSTDKNTTVTGLQNVEISPLKRRFNLSVGGGYVFDGKQFKPAIGIYLGATIFRF